MLEELQDGVKNKVYRIASDKKLQKYEKITDNMQEEIIFFSENLIQLPMRKKSSAKLRAILRISDELESLADACITIYRMLQKNRSILENEHAYEFIYKNFSSGISYYESVFESLREKDFFERDKAIVL